MFDNFSTLACDGPRRRRECRRALYFPGRSVGAHVRGYFHHDRGVRYRSYRRRRGVEAEQIEGSTALEITWSVIPFGIFMVIFVWGAVIYFKERTPPRGATEVYVVAKQWMWKLQHEEGQREINELHVPVGRDVKLIMTSQDVIHSFYVPAFRIKQDVLPGRYTTAWFHPTKAGTYHLFCAEYCGIAALRHDRTSCGDGTGAISGLAQRRRSTRDRWHRVAQNIFQQLGCSTCHRSDTQGRGPNLVGALRQAGTTGRRAHSHCR